MDTWKALLAKATEAGTYEVLTRDELYTIADQAEEENAQVIEAWHILSGYVLSCQKKNTREWMFGLEEAINRAAEMIGEEDRAVCDSDGMRLWLKKAEASL